MANKMKVYLLVNQWTKSNRSRGTRISVYDSIEKVQKAMEEDIKDYVSDQGDLDLEPEWEYDTGCYIDDECGNTSEWDIVPKEVQ